MSAPLSVEASSPPTDFPAAIQGTAITATPIPVTTTAATIDPAGGGIASDLFTVVGPNAMRRKQQVRRPPLLRERLQESLSGKPVFALVLLALIVLACLFAEGMANHDPAEFYLMNRNQPPDAAFWFGTDSLGRDIYSVIWHGGRTSLVVGLLSAAVITFLGITYGCVAGTAPAVLDTAMMRLVELLQSVPILLSLLLLSSLMGPQTPFSLALIIGITGWFPLARIVRSEVRQIRNSEYILAARCMGASYPRIMWRHLIPNFVSAVMFVIVSGVSTSIAMESTLSFLGLGLPLEVLSWGSMLALADRALLLNTWWVIVIPGIFLVTTLLCITSLGHYLRKQTNRGASHL